MLFNPKYPRLFESSVLIKNINFALILFTLFACGGQPDGQPADRTDEIIEAKEEPVYTPDPIERIESEEDNTDYEDSEIDIDDILENINDLETAAGTPLEDQYKVILSVDSNIKKHETGRLNVWIGAEDVEVSFSDRMTQDESTMPQSLGNYAKITPIAPDFEIMGDENNCYRIVPSGSEVVFILKPKETGSYEVSAKIEIYENPDCTGSAVPKAAKTLKVTVDVDTKKEAAKKVNTLLDVVWEKFLSFWGLLIAFLFTVLLFIIKRSLKKKTGYKEENNEES